MRENLPLAGDYRLSELKIHRLSGIVHRFPEGNILICGRLVTERYRAFRADDEDQPEISVNTALRV